MAEIEVVRIRTKFTLALPEHAQFVLRAARACGFAEPAAILAELCLDTGNPKTGIFLGFVDAEPRFIAVGFLPTSAFWLAANVALAYSERAPRALVRMTAAKVREWFVENGHNRIHFANLMHTDRSYIRGMAHFGRGLRIGSALEFRFD